MLHAFWGVIVVPFSRSCNSFALLVFLGYPYTSASDHGKGPNGYLRIRSIFQNWPVSVNLAKRLLSILRGTSKPFAFTFMTFFKLLNVCEFVFCTGLRKSVFSNVMQQLSMKSLQARCPYFRAFSKFSLIVSEATMPVD